MTQRRIVLALVAAFVAAFGACTGRSLVIPGPGDGSRDFSIGPGGGDLAGADLTGADLAGVDLAGTDGGDTTGPDMQPVPLPKRRGASADTGVAVLATDLDGDGNADLVVVESTGTVRIYDGDGKGDLFPRQAFEINTHTTLSTGILADVDADGVLDLVLAETEKSEVDVLRGNGDSTFADWSRTPITGGVTAVAVGDLNADGAPDLIATTQDGLLHVLQGMTGGKPVLLVPTYGVDTGTTQLGLPDLKGDGTLYAMSVAPGAGRLTFWTSNGDLTFGNRSYATEPMGSARFVLGDWDGDDLFDSATAGGASSGIVVVQVDLSGGVGSPLLLMPGLASTSFVDGLATGDMNGDGILDLVVSSDASSEMVFELASGAGAFPMQQMVELDEPASCLALADFDNDGHLDVAAAGPVKTQLYLTQP